MRSKTHDPSVKPQDQSQKTAIQPSESCDPTKEEILEGIKRGCQEALAGEHRPIEELLDDLEKQAPSELSLA